MSQCFPMAHLKTPWNGEGGREISRLWPPNIFPHPAPKSRPPAYSHRLYLIRLPRSPLMQGSEEGSEVTGSAVHCGGGGVTWYSSERAPHAQNAHLYHKRKRLPPRTPSSHLQAHHLPPYSRFTSRIPFSPQPLKSLLQNLPKRKNDCNKRQRWTLHNDRGINPTRR